MTMIGIGLGIALEPSRGSAIDSLPSKRLRLRADQATVSGGKVSSWADMWGAAPAAFAQSTDSKKPLQVLNAHNGRAALRGVDATTLLAAATETTVGTAGTICVVATRGAGNVYLFGGAASHGIISGFTGALVEWFNGADRYTLADTPTGLHIYTVTQTNGGALKGYVDGTEVFSHAATVALDTIKAVFNDVGGANGHRGDICELVVCGEVLSTAHLTAMHNDLAAYYGI